MSSRSTRELLFFILSICQLFWEFYCSTCFLFLLGLGRPMLFQLILTWSFHVAMSYIYQYSQCIHNNDTKQCTTKTDKTLNVSVSTNRCFTIHFKTIIFQYIFSEISEASTIFTHFLFAKSSQSITSLCRRPPSVKVHDKSCVWSYSDSGSEPNPRFLTCFEPLMGCDITSKLSLHLKCPQTIAQPWQYFYCM